MTRVPNPSASEWSAAIVDHTMTDQISVRRAPARSIHHPAIGVAIRYATENADDNQPYAVSEMSSCLVTVGARTASVVRSSWLTVIVNVAASATVQATRRGSGSRVICAWRGRYSVMASLSQKSQTSDSRAVPAEIGSSRTW